MIDLFNGQDISSEDYSAIPHKMLFYRLVIKFILRKGSERSQCSKVKGIKKGHRKFSSIHVSKGGYGSVSVL
jgi:hypothetical protein